MRQAGDETRAAQRPLAGDRLVDALGFLARQAVLQTFAVIGLAVERRVAAGPVVGMIGLPLRRGGGGVAGVAGSRRPRPGIGILRGAAAHRIGFQPHQRRQHPGAGLEQGRAVAAGEHPAAAQARGQVAAQRLHQARQAFLVGGRGQQQDAIVGKQPAVHRHTMTLGGFAQPRGKLVEDIGRGGLGRRRQWLNEVGLHQLGQPRGVQTGQTGHSVRACASRRTGCLLSRI